MYIPFADLANLWSAQVMLSYLTVHIQSKSGPAAADLHQETAPIYTDARSTCKREFNNRAVKGIDGLDNSVVKLTLS